MFFLQSLLFCRIAKKIQVPQSLAIALAHAAETLGFEFECTNYFFFFARTRLGDEHKMIFF